MDRTQYVQQRRGRYMAQTLEEFENTIEPLVSADVAQAFKAFVRRKFGAFSKDCVDILELEGAAMNGHAQSIKDGLNPDSSGGASSRAVTQTGGGE